MNIDTPGKLLSAFRMAGLIAVGSIAPAWGAPPANCPTPFPATPLTLSDAIESALCRNSTTAAAWASIQVRKAELELAKAAFFPTVGGSLAIQENMQRDAGQFSAPGRQAGLNGSLSANWRIFDFGERAAQKNTAQYLLSAAQASHDDAVRSTLSRTLQAYLDASQARATLAARDAAVKQAELIAQSARRREAGGVAARTDTLQADTALARARLTWHKAAAEAAKAQAQLGHVIGLPAGVPLSLSETALPAFQDEVPDLARVLDHARRQHPAIQAAAARLRAAETRIAAARAQGRPTLDLGLSLGRAPATKFQHVPANATSAALTLNIPIFDGQMRQHRIHQAKAQAHQSSIEASETTQQVLLELIQAHVETTSAKEVLTAIEALQEIATESLESARNRYERGAGDMLEMLSAQSALNDAMESRAQAESQWHAARLRLMVDIGQLDRANFLLPLSKGSPPAFSSPPQAAFTNH